MLDIKTNFNPIIESLGTFISIMDITIFVSKIDNFVLIKFIENYV